MYNTYRFRNKDPVIDILRTLLEIEASITNTSFSATIRRIARNSGVAESTLWSWFSGPTRCPRFAGVMAVAHACGKEVTLGGTIVGSRFPLKIVA